MKKKLVSGMMLLVFSVVTLTACGSEGFDKMYSGIANETWCSITSDGYGMKIDTNPDDKELDDMLQAEYDEMKRVVDKVKEINKELGFSDALFEKMNTTNAIDGTQNDSNDKYTVSWSYSPSKGLEVLYEVKK